MRLICSYYSMKSALINCVFRAIGLCSSFIREYFQFSLFIMSHSSHYFSRHVPSTPQNLPEARPVRVAGSTLQMATGRGVFAKSGLDAGSRLLLETALPALGVLPAGARICDLGCGWGALGCFLAARLKNNSVVMGDINGRAAWLANFNAQQNNLQNTGVWCGDGLRAAQSESFDAIVSNPPIRAGNAALGVLFADAHRCLKPGGELWAVIRTAQGAKSWQKRLEHLFGNCETVVIKNGYRVLKGTRE
jgi:16S rRNA (guanine1207-N2)-methyltransferase